MVLVVTLLFTSQAFATPGDYLFQWGAQYHFRVLADAAMDAAGNFYVIDTGNSMVQKFDSSGNFITAWGSSGSGDGQFKGPNGISVDGDGNVYVGDIGNSRIEKFDNSGRFVTAWGSRGSGNGQFTGLNHLATSRNGDVYVIDYGNFRVEKFDSSGNFITAWGSHGLGPGQFSSPNGIAVDGSGNVFVVDGGTDMVQKFDASGVFISAWGGSGTAVGSFEGAYSIATDGSHIFVADSGNSRIQAFDGSGTFLRAWSTGSSPYNSYALAADGNGTVLGIEQMIGRIKKFSASGDVLSVWESQGTGNGQFNSPYGAAVDSLGNVYVADTSNNRVQKFSASGTFLASWGYPFSSIQFNAPFGVAVDKTGNIYVADTYNHRVVKLDSNGAYLAQWGFLPSVSAGTGQFTPTGIAVDGSGNVYVADKGNGLVEKFDGFGNVIISWGGSGAGAGQFNGLFGLAVDTGGNVYVADSYNNRIQKFDNAGVYLSEWGSPGTGPGQFQTPSAVAADERGNVYVADTMNNRIQVFDSAQNYLGTFGSFGIKNGQVNYPVGLAANVTGTMLYVPDDFNNRIEAFAGYGYLMPPVSTATASGIAGGDGWYASNVNVTLTATGVDTDVQEIHYRIDSGNEVVVQCVKTATVTITTDGYHILTYYAVDNLGTQESAHTLNVNIDRSPPAISIAGVANGATYLLGAIPTPTFTTADALSGVASQNAALTGGNGNGVGSYTYTVTATDKAGNLSSQSVAFTVDYLFGGFVSPLSGTTAKSGNNVAVKFQLLDAAGRSITSATASLMLQLHIGSTPVGMPIPASSTSGGNSGNAFRYDLVDKQYIFNLNTRGLSVGAWQLMVTTDDGVTRTTYINLK